MTRLVQCSLCLALGDEARMMVTEEEAFGSHRMAHFEARRAYRDRTGLLVSATHAERMEQYRLSEEVTS